MKDQSKTRQVLIQELASLRERITELEQSESERKQLEEALRENQEQLRDAHRLAHIGIWHWIADTDTVTWTEELYRIAGLDPMIPAPTYAEHRNIYAPESWDRLKAAVEKALETGAPYQLELELIRPDGTTRWVNAFGGAMYDNHGRVTGLHGTVQDISERKQAMEKLRESEQKFKELFERISSGVAVYEAVDDGEDFIFRDFNSAGEVIEQVNREDIIGKRVTEVFPGVKEFGVFAVLQRVWKTGESEYLSERLYKDEHGNATWRESWVYKLPGGEIVAIYNNTTDRKKAEDALRQNAENFSRSLEDSPLGIRIVSIAGETIYANRAILDIYGYDSLEDFRATPVEKRYTPESYAEHNIRRGKRKRGNDAKSEYGISITKKDGEVRHLQVFRKEILWDGERQFQVLYNDITERKRMEKLLQETEKHYRQLAEDMPALICTFLPDSTLTYVNSTYCALFQKRSDELIGQKFLDFLPNEADRENVRRQYMSLTPENPVKTYEHDVIISDGTSQYHWHRWTDRAFFKDNGEIDHFQSIGQDIADRKQAEEELRTSRTQLRALATRLQQIREEERVMISREVHDEMGGGLTGLKMDLSWLLHKMSDADPGKERVALMDKIKTANALIDEMIQVVRRISTDLRPSILDDLGLIAALEWQLSEFTSHTEIPHEFATTLEDVDMEDDTAVSVFRIFQETLTNVVRHAHATKVVVVLREGERSLFGDEALVLEIRDNGKGITEEEIMNPRSLGLLGMKERVLRFGGNLSIRGEPGGGTTLVLIIPRKQ